MRSTSSASISLSRKRGDRVHAVNVDVTDRPGMEKAAEETVRVFGKIHVLVNNAGVVHRAPEQHHVRRLGLADARESQLCVLNCMHAFLPRIQPHGEGGQIITTSSVLGLFAGNSGASHSTSKFAVVGMMEALRAELTSEHRCVRILSRTCEFEGHGLG